MQEIKNVCDFYAVTHRLKNTLRTGWVHCGVDAKRLESVGEHIYGAQMLALSIYSEFKLDLDISKVALLLAVHELGECIIGDIPAVGAKISREEKKKLEHEAAKQILGKMMQPQAIMEAFTEFEERKTKEAKFAHLIDKLECDMQCKYYEEKGVLDFDKLTPIDAQLARIIDRKAQGYKRFSDFWIDNDIKMFFEGDEMFEEIAKYIKENEIFS